jgi:2-polyprenyl-6-methoxyphenol hydroxylase-like FAD-dependent oxidoreductase
MHDVVIAGAGPNGLMLACELSLAGVRPLLLEAREERGIVQRANGLVGRVVQVMDYRGLYQRFTGSDNPPVPAPGFMFGSLPLNLYRLPANPMYTLQLPQQRLEEHLAARAAELGAEVANGHRLTGLRQDADGVTIEVDGPDGPYELRARYLIGCDGGKSTVRKLTGIGFPGYTNDRYCSRTGWVRLPDAEALDVPGHGRLLPATFTRTEQGLFAYLKVAPGIFMFNASESDVDPVPDDVPMTFDELRAAITRVLGTELPIEPPEVPNALLRRVSGVNTRLADRYRDGRVFLLGDAAHVHSATGGPGLNLGLQDAVNLGWKLAARINGHAGEELLDSYESERYPVGRRVMMSTMAQTLLNGPGPQVTAMRALFGELLDNEDNIAHIANLMAGADVRYETDQRGDHPLLGRWMPDLHLITGEHRTRVGELMRPATAILLDFENSTELARATSAWADRLRVVHATCTTPGEQPARAVLIRPDGYVAWVADQDDPVHSGLTSALTRWLGEPATA